MFDDKNPILFKGANKYDEIEKSSETVDQYFQVVNNLKGYECVV